MEHLNEQISKWKNQLVKELKIPLENCGTLATIINGEISALRKDDRINLLGSNPVDLNTRIEELDAFQKMMETFNNKRPRPEIVRTQVISQNYICFVYLKDSLFEKLKRTMPSESITKKCCKYLLNNPVRAFRNAIAHGNWKYKNDFSGMEFWAHKGEYSNEPMDKWEVNQELLSFWQALSRLIAYVVVLELKKENTP